MEPTCAPGHANKSTAADTCSCIHIMNFRLTLALSVLALAGCMTKPAPSPAQILPDVQTGAPDSGLRQLADKRGLLLGTAVPLGRWNPQTDGGQFERVLRQNFNMIEPEND